MANTGAKHVSAEALRGLSFFRGFEEAERALIAGLAELVTIEKGVEFLHEGDKGDAMYILVDGSVAVIHRDEQGHTYELARLGKGEFFGEVALIDDKARSADIVALEPSTAIRVSHSDVCGMALGKPSVALKFFVAIARTHVARTREANLKYIEALSRIPG